MTPNGQEILELLVAGLQRLEYRGYDSAGLALDTGDNTGWGNIDILFTMMVTLHWSGQ